MRAEISETENRKQQRSSMGPKTGFFDNSLGRLIRGKKMSQTTNIRNERVDITTDI